MLRAHAYLQLGNVDNSKRDLSAILRSDPEHTQAKALHRQLKRFQKALDDAAKHEAARDWGACVERYDAAREAISPPIETPALQQGLCNCALRKREGAKALAWCEKAYNGSPDDVRLLFLHADAKVLNGEEHAGLQALKTAQRRFPRNYELHDKIQKLEQRIRNKGKVNYYKVLGVGRTASTRDVKRAYHKLAKQYHPDKVESDADKPAAEAMFKKVARAYEVLGDEDMRRRYDAGEDVDDANAMNARTRSSSSSASTLAAAASAAAVSGGGGGRRHHYRYR